MEGGVDKSLKTPSYEKNNAKDDIHKIDDNVKSSKVNKASNVIKIQRNDLQSEKKAFCSDDVKKHVSALCKCLLPRKFILPILLILPWRFIPRFPYHNSQSVYIKLKEK